MNKQLCKGIVNDTIAELRRVIVFSVLICLEVLFLSCEAFPSVYEVGPGKEFEGIGQVPLDTLEPGDIVRIYYRQEPYREKFILRRSGTKENPIVIMGVPEGDKLPIIGGSLSNQFQEEQLFEPGRWLIKVGDGTPGDYIQIKNLELRNANNSQAFVIAGHVQGFDDNAAGVFVRFGRHVLITGCIIHSCGNGIQTSYGPKVSHVTLNGCRIYDNGNHLDFKSDQEHNVYLCGTNSIIQGCRFGDTHSDGNNIKDRGLNTIIRYNWIEGGKNRQLDLVDYIGYGRADAYVYGNMIIQGGNVNNNNMIHWGGDSGHIRSGTLYLFNNTILAKAEETRFIIVRYPDCSVGVKNNVFMGSGKLWNEKGILQGSNNWFSLGINIPPHLSLGFQGRNPGFSMIPSTPYMPHPGSRLINNGTNHVPMKVEYMPTPYTGGFRRPNDGRMDIGAFEFSDH
jgi:hypothetical protein